LVKSGDTFSVDGPKLPLPGTALLHPAPPWAPNVHGESAPFRAWTGPRDSRPQTPSGVLVPVHRPHGTRFQRRPVPFGGSPVPPSSNFAPRIPTVSGHRWRRATRA